MKNMNLRKERVLWFSHDRFAIFIHCGVHSVPGRGAWYRSDDKIPSDEYGRHAEFFDPCNTDNREVI